MELWSIWPDKGHGTSDESRGSRNKIDNGKSPTSPVIDTVGGNKITFYESHFVSCNFHIIALLLRYVMGRMIYSLALKEISISIYMLRITWICHLKDRKLHFTPFCKCSVQVTWWPSMELLVWYPVILNCISFEDRVLVSYIRMGCNYLTTAPLKFENG